MRTEGRAAAPTSPRSPPPSPPSPSVGTSHSMICRTLCRALASPIATSWSKKGGGGVCKRLDVQINNNRPQRTLARTPRQRPPRPASPKPPTTMPRSVRVRRIAACAGPQQAASATSAASQQRHTGRPVDGSVNTDTATQPQHTSARTAQSAVQRVARWWYGGGGVDAATHHEKYYDAAICVWRFLVSVRLQTGEEDGGGVFSPITRRT